MTFFSQGSEARIIYIGIWFVSKAYKRLPFPNLTKIGDLDFCIYHRGKIIQMRRVVSFNVNELTVASIFSSQSFENHNIRKNLTF